VAAESPFGVAGRLSVSDEEKFRCGHNLLLF